MERVRESESNFNQFTLTPSSTEQHTQSGDRTWQSRKSAKAEEQRDQKLSLVKQMNKLYEQIRVKAAEPEERTVAVNKLHTTLQGKVAEFSLRPDLSRCIQSCFKFGSAEVRTSILAELKGRLAVLSKGKHSCFLVLVFIQHGDTEHILTVFKELLPHTRRLNTHSAGAKVINQLLSLRNKDIPLARMWDQVYGGDFALFAAGLNLRDGLLKLSKNQRTGALTHVKATIAKHGDKAILRFAFAQKLLWEFIKVCIDNENFPDLHDHLQILIPTIREANLVLISSKEGVQALEVCLLAAPAKEKRKIVRTWKDRVQELAAHEYGHVALLRALDCTDDTVMLNKSVLQELLGSNLVSVLSDPHSRKPVLHILSPRDSRFFSPSDMQWFKDEIDGREKLLSAAKKPKENRHKELLAHIQPLLMNLTSEDFVVLANDKLGSDVVVAMTQAYPEDMRTVVETLLQDQTVLDGAIGHKTLQRCVEVLDQVEVEDLQGLAGSNRGCFVLLSMLKRNAALKTPMSGLNLPEGEGADLLKALLGAGKKGGNKAGKKVVKKKTAPAPVPRRRTRSMSVEEEEKKPASKKSRLAKIEE